MTFDIIKKSFMGYGKQPIIALAFLFRLIALVAVMLPAILIISVIIVGLTGVAAGAEITQEMITAIVPLMIIMPSFLITAFIAVIAVIFISCFFSAGSLGMAYDIANNKKTSIKSMMDYGKKFWWRYVGVSLLILLIVLGLLIVILPVALPLMTMDASTIKQNIPLLVLVCIIAAAFLLFLFLFILSPYMLIIKNTGAKGAIKNSFVFVRKNLGQTLLLAITLLAIVIVIDYIPIIGSLVNLFVIAPVQVIAFMIFVMGKMKREKKGKGK